MRQNVFDNNVDTLIGGLDINKKCKDLYLSNGIDCKAFANNFVFPRIAVRVTLEWLAEESAPMHWMKGQKDLLEDYKALMHYVGVDFNEHPD